MNSQQLSGRLDGQVCLVTGALRGIGNAIAGYLFQAGASVALLDYRDENSAEVCAGLDPEGKRAAFFKTDVTSESSVSGSIAAVLERFGRIDVLVNCAGILKHKPIEQLSLEDFESVVRTNLTGTFLMCRGVLPAMKAQGRGKIVNMASLGGRTGRPGVGVNYAASKAGVIGLTQTLAKEAGPSGIYVNALAPGPVLTELTKQVGPEVFATWNVGRAVRKDGLPEDIASAVLFLASGQSDWITGVTLDINGGIFIT